MLSPAVIHKAQTSPDSNRTDVAVCHPFTSRRGKGRPVILWDAAGHDWKGFEALQERRQLPFGSVWRPLSSIGEKERRRRRKVFSTILHFPSCAKASRRKLHPLKFALSSMSHDAWLQGYIRKYIPVDRVISSVLRQCYLLSSRKKWSKTKARETDRQTDRQIENETQWRKEIFWAKRVSCCYKWDNKKINK